MKNLFLADRFFYFFGAIVLVFVASFMLDGLFIIAQLFLLIAVIVALVEGFLLFRDEVDVEVERVVPKVFSLSDENEVILKVKNLSNETLDSLVIDELPIQFQKRDFEIAITLEPKSVNEIPYALRPVERGEYSFGNIHVFIKSNLGLLERRITSKVAEEVAVYPSILQMKQLELKAFERITNQDGIKKMRRIGHSYEFEQIKNYVKGDDFRSINWKATSRQNQLMVNSYQDERSQQVYCVIDKSRVMNMPFNELALLDYAINSTLALSNIVLRKYDKVGLLTFSDKLGSVIKADRKAGQLNKITHALYKEKDHKLEANYELLYHAVRRLIPSRSLLLMYTNFESVYALDRVLPMLRRVNRFHLLVVVFFENTEIKDFATQPVATLEGIYTQSVAQKFVSDKQQMVQKLKQYGIQSVLTRPEDLSIDTINKYLELKARGLI